MSRRWYREPMVWLMLALPASAVIAGFVTLGIAGMTSWDASPDAVTRVAQVQTADRSPDERAAERALSAVLRVDRRGETVAIKPEGDFEAHTVVLHFAHAADASRDQVVTMTAGNTGEYVGTAPLATGAYNLTLVPADASFRLRGRLDADVDTATLMPSVTQ